VQSAWGWVTSTKTRPVMLTDLGGLLRDNKLQLHCERTLNDISSFVRVDGSRRAEAATGANDDMVMSLAIAGSAEVREFGLNTEPAKGRRGML
jgi:hypothetical protein